MPKLKEVRLNIRIEEGLKNRIDQAAKDEDRTTTSLVINVMKKWLDEHYPKTTEFSPRRQPAALAAEKITKSTETTPSALVDTYPPFSQEKL